VPTTLPKVNPEEWITNAGNRLTRRSA
jgi:hypothetical protein